MFDDVVFVPPPLHPVHVALPVKSEGARFKYVFERQPLGNRRNLVCPWGAYGDVEEQEEKQ